MVTELARSWIQSLSFLVNLRTGTRAKAMIWTMVYTKMSNLKNAGDKSIGGVWFLLYNLFKRLQHVL